jgi:hypothetical protein
MEPRIINVNGLEIRVKTINNDDYVCLTDVAKGFNNADDLVRNWLRNKNTLEFLGVWEKLNNENFNYVEFDVIKNEAGSNKFTINPKQWAIKTNAIGIVSRAGKYDSGTYAQIDIALEFCSWISPEFKLYLIKEFQRLKKEEAGRNNLDWNLQRVLSKVNYKIHTDAIKNNIVIPRNIEKTQEWLIYASEADIINYAIFGKTAKQWRDAADIMKKGKNMRDFATAEELLVVANCESANATMIRDGISREERLKKLIIQAKEELQVLNKNKKLTKDDTLFKQIEKI